MSSLVIRHHSITYRLPTTGEITAGQTGMEAACSTLLANALSALSIGNGEGIWLIRDLQVHTSAMAHWLPAEIAGCLANQIVNQIREVLSRGPDGFDVLWFPSRAALVARLLVEVAEKTAQRAWYLSEFRELASLSCGVALARLAQQEPETVREAICYLLPPEERLILRIVSPKEASQILRALSGNESGISPAAWPGVLATLESILAAGEDSQSAPQLALRVFFVTLRGGFDSSALAIARTASCAADILFSVRMATRPPAAIKAWLTKEWAALREFLSPEEFARLASYEPLPAEVRQRLAALATGERPASAMPEAGDTPFGGMFLLLPLLEVFDWREWLDSVPALGPHDPVTLFQLLTIGGALGGQRTRRVLDDAILRKCLGIDPRLTVDQIEKWFEEIPIRGDLAGRWASTLERSRSVSMEAPTFGASSNGPMRIDVKKGIWIGRGQGETDSDIAEDEAAISLRGVLPDDFAEVVLLTSQALLREFAIRLPGFAASSIPFLHENFLEFAASVSEEETRQVVYADKPPLHIVLALNGMSRKRFRLPCSGGWEWILASRT